MTTETQGADWRTMAAGRELDALVAERVMGSETRVRHTYRKVAGRYRTTEPVTYHEELPARDRSSWRPLLGYATHDPSARWVVQEMERRGFWLSLRGPFVPGEWWRAGFTPHGTSGWNGRPDFEGSGDTPALAICRAALAAVEASHG